MVTKCKLKPISKQLVHGVHGSQESFVYLVNIKLDSDVSFVGIPVTEGKLPGETNVLLGMDIINKGDFALTHSKGNTILSFRVPSIGTIDFVEEAKKKSIPTTGFKVGRNAPCPCGSGKKYKKCCVA